MAAGSSSVVTALLGAVQMPIPQAFGVSARRVQHICCTANIAADAKRQALLTALTAAGRRGRWKTSLELLKELEGDGSGVIPRTAWHSALVACRKHRRQREALGLLARMGAEADTAAANEALHALRLAADFGSAQLVWRAMNSTSLASVTASADADGHTLTFPPSETSGALVAEAAMAAASIKSAAIQPDAFSYHHMLNLCCNSGLWSEALALLDGMEAREVRLDPGHYLAALRACSRDRRWQEAAVLVRRIPDEFLSKDRWLASAALTVCAESADAATAQELVVRHLRERAGASEYAEWLQACRRAADVEGARAAWARLSSNDVAADEQCYAMIITCLLEGAQEARAQPRYDITDVHFDRRVVSATASALAPAAVASSPPRSTPSTDSPSDVGPDGVELEAEALRLVRVAAETLPASVTPVVLTAALGSAISTGAVKPARTALELLCERSGGVEPAAQLRVLRLCADVGAWVDVAAEADTARSRRLADDIDTHVRHRLAALCDACAEPDGGTRTGADAASTEAATGMAFDTPCHAVGRQAATMALQKLLGQWEDASAADGAEMQRRPTSAQSDESSPPDEGLVSESTRMAARRYSRSIALPGDDLPLHVIWEDDDLLAVCKPASIPVVPRHRFEGGAMVNRVVSHLGGRSPYVLHRLDSPTSGLLLFGKTLTAARSLHHQFRERLLQKTYYAVLSGCPEERAFSVDVPLARHLTDRKLSRTVLLEDEDGERAQHALTHFEVLQTSLPAALCEVRPVTGRMHQIRVHANHLGHPLAGDPQYVSAVDGTPPLECSRLMLHARSLDISHPTNGQHLRFVAALPDDFVDALGDWGFSWQEGTAAPGAWGSVSVLVPDLPATPPT